MNELLLLTEAQINWAAKSFDERFDFTEIIKNKIVGMAAEAIDTKVPKWMLGILNAKVSPFVPDEIKDELQAALDDVIDGDKDFTVAVENAIEVIDQLKEKLNVEAWIKALIDTILDLLKAILLDLIKPE